MNLSFVSRERRFPNLFVCLFYINQPLTAPHGTGFGLWTISAAVQWANSYCVVTTQGWPPDTRTPSFGHQFSLSSIAWYPCCRIYAFSTSWLGSWPKASFHSHHAGKKMYIHFTPFMFTLVDGCSCIYTFMLHLSVDEMKLDCAICLPRHLESLLLLVGRLCCFFHVHSFIHCF